MSGASCPCNRQRVSEHEHRSCRLGLQREVLDSMATPDSHSCPRCVQANDQTRRNLSCTRVRRSMRDGRFATEISFDTICKLEMSNSGTSKSGKNPLGFGENCLETRISTL